jgi:hypothetical protein
MTQQDLSFHYVVGLEELGEVEGLEHRASLVSLVEESWVVGELLKVVVFEVLGAVVANILWGLGRSH